MKRKKKEAVDSAFVNDGYERTLVACAPEIQTALDAERAHLQRQFADQLAGAGFLKRFWLYRRIGYLLRAKRRELREKFAPRDGLYFGRP